MAIENNKNEFVFPIEGDEKFDYKPEEGAQSQDHDEQAEGFTRQAAHLSKLLGSRKAELASLQKLQIQGVASDTMVANKEVEIEQITADLATAERNAQLASSEAEKTKPASEEFVFPVDWNKENNTQ